MDTSQRKTIANLLPSAIPGPDMLVPRNPLMLPELLLADVEPADGVKLLVAGQKGMGKTTELQQSQREAV